MDEGEQPLKAPAWPNAQDSKPLSISPPARSQGPIAGWAVQFLMSVYIFDRRILPDAEQLHLA
jgi:hypothetical protein